MFAGLRLAQHGWTHNKFIICETKRRNVKLPNDIERTVPQNKQTDTQICAIQ